MLSSSQASDTGSSQVYKKIKSVAFCSFDFSLPRSIVYCLLSVIFFLVFPISTFSATTTITIGDGVDATSTTVAPGTGAINADAFTIQSSTSSNTIYVTSALVKLNGGAKNDGSPPARPRDW
jgi:hypothetical protein